MKRLRKFNESSYPDEKSESQILSGIKSIFDVLEDDNDINLKFIRKIDGNYLEAIIKVYLHPTRQGLSELIDISKCINDYKITVKVLTEIHHLLKHMESEYDYKWELDAKRMDGWNYKGKYRNGIIRIVIKTGKEMTEDFDDTIKDWEEYGEDEFYFDEYDEVETY
jgi:hypothetical protein